MTFWVFALALMLFIWAAGWLAVFIAKDTFLPSDTVKRWDRVINSERDDLPILYIKNLFHLWGRRIDLHKIIYPDPWECFHSHPATAVRVILWGGYVEEYYDGKMVERRPGHIGIVHHDDVHRINRLRYESPSYSLWFRGKVRHQTQLKGTGWPVELQDTWHGSSEK